MKKLLVLTLAFTFAMGLTACSGTDNGGTKKKNTTAAQTDVKKPLVKFYMELTKKINANDADLNAYEAAPDASLAEKASDSAAAVAKEIKAIQIPKELNEKKADLNAALKDIADSYQAKVDELKKDSPSLDSANAAFTKGVDELGEVFESVKLFKPDLGKEVN